MHQANLTRFGPQTFEQSQDTPATHSATFAAIDGPANLVLQHEDIKHLELKVNGTRVNDSQSVQGSGQAVISLDLKQENSIELSVSGKLNLRITQAAEADLKLQRQGYFGVNTSDMERQRAFYETLGFIGEIYPAGPETSTTFAQALGFEDDYLIHVSLHSLENPPNMPFVDTVQFRGESYRDEAPYANLNHLGMAFATYSTPDLSGDVNYLQSKGVEFLSAPTEAPNGEQFAFFKDQDGTFLKLIQAAGGEAQSTHPNLARLVSTNMNVSDLERSREFYRLLGFTESKRSSQKGSGDFAAAYGFNHEIEFEDIEVSLGKGTDGATIQLRQWKTPFDDAPPYAPPVNHLGIDRINFYVKDLTPVVATMNALGFKQLGPIGGSTEIGIVFFFDPDGIKVQLAGPQLA